MALTVLVMVGASAFPEVAGMVLVFGGPAALLLVGAHMLVQDIIEWVKS